MSVRLPAETGSETCERIVLSVGLFCVTIACQQAVQVTVACVLPHTVVERRRHLGK